jgi:ribosomal protein S18 acetylase RimI-like enzyme
MIVRLATPMDLPEIVRVHQAAFPGFFLTQLGPTFLREYYRTVCDFEDGIALLACTKSGVAEGFVAGFVRPAAFYQLLRSRRVRLGVAAMPALLRRPTLLPRLLRNGRRAADSSRGPQADRESELASIGVAPTGQGKGIGRALVAAFIEHSRARGADRVSLTTDVRDNESVNRFYQTLGFHVAGVETVGERLMNRYELPLRTEGSIKRAA